MMSRGKSVDATDGESGRPAELYSRRLEELRKSQAVEQRRERTMGYSKLVIALCVAITAVMLINHPMALGPLLALIAVFVLLAVIQERATRKIRYGARAIAFYERGLARISGTWEGNGETGERFLDPMHPYARDLDIFGRASLFELLCTARTRAGEETLAQWLLRAAPVKEVLERQTAVGELGPQVRFREKLFSFGESVRLGLRPEALAAWGEHNPDFSSQWTVGLTVMGGAWVASLVCWAVWDWPWFALFASLLNFFYYLRLQGRIEQAANPVEKASADLKLLAELLALLENGKFSSPKLLQIQAQMRCEGIAPSAAIRKLARIAEYLESRRNQFARVIDLFTFWGAQLVFAAERWQREFGSSIRGWLDAVGEFEALTALAGFAYEHPEYVFPEFADEGPLFEAEGFAHPLLPDHNAVTNNLRLGDGLQLILLSGPNMAGKSTFIRGVGVSAVLAQCGAPVRALGLRLSPLQVGASICVLDSLSGGMSRFYAEIHRVKLICDLTLDSEPTVPVLFLLDELLSGTNSQDRLEGTRLVLESLLERDAIGIVSTHDLALTQIPETLGERAVNCHFEDRLENEELIFDYKLKPGIVQTSNALKLMRSIGLGRLGVRG
jgi:hypothetical protein